MLTMKKINCVFKLQHAEMFVFISCYFPFSLRWFQSKCVKVKRRVRGYIRFAVKLLFDSQNNLKIVFDLHFFSEGFA